MTELWDLELIIKGYVVNEKKSYQEGNITSTIVYVECYKRFYLSLLSLLPAVANGDIPVVRRVSCMTLGWPHPGIPYYWYRIKSLTFTLDDMKAWYPPQQNINGLLQ